MFDPILDQSRVQDQNHGQFQENHERMGMNHDIDHRLAFYFYFYFYFYVLFETFYGVFNPCVFYFGLALCTHFCFKHKKNEKTQQNNKKIKNTKTKKKKIKNVNWLRYCNFIEKN